MRFKMKVGGINTYFIADYIKYFNVSKEELCNKADISMKDLERVLNDDIAISVEVICKIAIAIKLPVGNFIYSLADPVDFSRIELF